MQKLYIETPLLESTPLSKLLGIPVLLKMEALQPSGSFKNRGIGHLCLAFAGQGAKCFISSSGEMPGLLSPIAAENCTYLSKWLSLPRLYL